MVPMAHAPKRTMMTGMNAPHATQVMKTVSVEEEALPESWFEAKPRLSTVPPPRRSSMPPAVVMGDFLGDELADAWLR